MQIVGYINTNEAVRVRGNMVGGKMDDKILEQRINIKFCVKTGKKKCKLNVSPCRIFFA